MGYELVGTTAGEPVVCVPLLIIGRLVQHEELARIAAGRARHTGRYPVIAVPGPVRRRHRELEL